MEKVTADDIFSVLSKLTIIVPLIIIVVALLIKFNKTPSNYLTNNLSLIKTSPTVKPNKINNLKIDLIGPWKCDFILNDSSISAIIKNKKAFARVEQNNLIEYYAVNGDCLYRWQALQYSGDKYCGLLPIISIAEMMTNLSGGLDIKALSNSFSQMGMSKITADNLKKINLNKSCQKKEPPINIFEVPTNILFRKVEVTPTLNN